jgi:hypothetical protein
MVSMTVPGGFTVSGMTLPDDLWNPAQLIMQMHSAFTTLEQSMTTGCVQQPCFSECFNFVQSKKIASSSRYFSWSVTRTGSTFDLKAILMLQVKS